MARTREIHLVFGKTYDTQMPIGTAGENKATRVVLQCANVLERWPGAVFSVHLQRATDAAPYIADAAKVPDKDGQFAYDMVAADVSIPGQLTMEVQARENGVVVIAATYQFMVTAGLYDGTPLDPQPTWVQNVLNASATATQGAVAATNQANRAEQEADRAQEAADQALGYADAMDAKVRQAGDYAQEAGEMRDEAQDIVEDFKGQVSSGTWGGDMWKGQYDTDASGVVDDAERLGGVPAARYATKPVAAVAGNLAMLDENRDAVDSGVPWFWVQAPVHLYAGRDLSEYTPADFRAMCQATDFSEIRVGDFYPVTLSTNEVMLCEIAGIDTYFRYGDTSTGHHIDMISRDCLAALYTYNATATNSGGYVGSALRTTLNGTIYNTLPAALRAVIVQKRGLVETKTAADATTYSWQDLGNLWLPAEREVWGQGVWSELKWGAGLAVQYPIFQGSLRHVSKGAGNGGNRATWWLLSSRSGSTTEFCAVQLQGYPRYYSAASTGSVPLCFRIGA